MSRKGMRRYEESRGRPAYRKRFVMDMIRPKIGIDIAIGVGIGTYAIETIPFV
jgi:hypothetical protein